MSWAISIAYLGDILGIKACIIYMFMKSMSPALGHLVRTTTLYCLLPKLTWTFSYTLKLYQVYLFNKSMASSLLKFCQSCSYSTRKSFRYNSVMLIQLAHIHKIIYLYRRVSQASNYTYICK